MTEPLLTENVPAPLPGSTPAPEPPAAAPPARVAWGRVALYYAIAFGMVSVLGVVLWRLGASLTDSAAALAFQLIVAFLYMPMPLVAGLIVERVAGRRPLIRSEWPRLKHGFVRVVAISAAAATLIYLTNLALTALLGNLAGVPGVGHLVTSQAELLDTIAGLIPAAAASAAPPSMPPLALLYPLGLVSGLLAGFTINGLFAFGEEYGWRGVLMDELAPLGPVKANLLTGVLWGLWHAPIILLGFNYGTYRYAGIAMMCVWLVPFSFLQWRAREYSGSIVAPAVIHGAFNGSSGFFLLLVAGRNPLVAVPVGLVAALCLTIVAIAAWYATRNRIRGAG